MSNALYARDVDAVKASDVVGDWGRPMGRVFMCPGGPVPEDECDCGYVGDWEYRWVYLWYEHPGFVRTDRTIREDMARGFPPRPKDEGWWVMSGRDGRCPACGDIERYDLQGECIAVNLNRAGRIKRASELRDLAEEMEHEAWRTPREVDAPASVTKAGDGDA